MYFSHIAEFAQIIYKVISLSESLVELFSPCNEIIKDQSMCKT